MPAPDQSDILLALYEYLASKVSTLTPSFPAEAVSYPNRSFTPPRAASGDDTKASPYLSVKFMPNFTERDSIGFSSPSTSVGLLQVSVFWPSDEGLVKPLRVASQIAALFSSGLELKKNQVAVYVNEEPDVADSIQESDLVQVPVTVSWVACPLV